MSNELIFGMLLGGAMAIVVMATCKPAQNAINKGKDFVKSKVAKM